MTSHHGVWSKSKQAFDVRSPQRRVNWKPQSSSVLSLLLAVQLRLASKGLAGSPRAQVQGDSPHSQHSNATGSPWSTVSSPDWHSTPRWPQYADFAAHSSRPANPSMLFHVTSAQPTLEDEHQLEVPCPFCLSTLPFFTCMFLCSACAGI